MANKKVAFTDSVKKFILDKMAEGNDIAQICRQWPDKVPHKKSVYRKSLDDPEFASQIDQAYTILLMHRLDDLHRIASTPASELYPNLDGREAENAKKWVIDVAKFALSKMGPVLSKRFNKTDKIEVSGQGLAPQIAIVSYLSPKLELESGSTITLAGTSTSALTSISKNSEE